MKLSFFYFIIVLNRGRPKVPIDLYLAFFGSTKMLPKLLDSRTNYILKYVDVNRGGEQTNP